ncbi:hypothetical protein [Hymenobacter elongatus]|uniref:DUF4401 domain-containing protein n=1 Tax=Hymenobacter elongatus TaxID=877208 RepID=A0A4Z0PNE0_9BACT|nr:hypothetical protein [Hymenobacter elongatus]TGE18570.1 hypothetical protein E5J99_04510 [Hymenobacter elongatus]
MNTKAYNEEWIFNREVQRMARRWHKRGFVSAEQNGAIALMFPSGFHERHFFVRITLFIFTGIGAGIAGSLIFGTILTAVFSGHSSQETGFLVCCLLCGGGTIFLLEQLIHANHFYHSGPDNALLYIALSYFLTALGFFYAAVLPTQLLDPELLLARGLLGWLLLPAWVLLLAAVGRYADAFVTLAAHLLYLVIVAVFTLQLSWGKALLPFVLMLACAGSYQAGQWCALRPDSLYYRTCLRVTKVVSLAGFYLAGNYLVVREANALLNDLPASIQISFAPLFYLFTGAIPLTYIVLGLRRADRIFLHTGLLTLAFSLYTYRFYRSVLPPEWALTLGGALLIVLAGAALRYLRPARHGLTAEPADSPQLSVLDLESVVLSQVAEAGMKVPEPGFRFGGGSTGGGGAEGAY